MNDRPIFSEALITYAQETFWIDVSFLCLALLIPVAADVMTYWSNNRKK